MTPGLHLLKLKPVTGCLRTLPVLLLQLNINRRQARLDANFALYGVSLAIPAAVARRREESKQRLGCSKTESFSFDSSIPS
ncbi:MULTISPECIES: hypothetical protein [unclassified Microcoleus]|uniref:hypothetical protein n=1 Tax=unclassified Microcoleus TaxID=2642155 RepID=UPI002FD0A09C